MKAFEKVLLCRAFFVNFVWLLTKHQYEELREENITIISVDLYRINVDIYCRTSVIRYMLYGRIKEVVALLGVKTMKTRL